VLTYNPTCTITVYINVKSTSVRALMTVFSEHNRLQIAVQLISFPAGCVTITTFCCRQFCVVGVHWIHTGRPVAHWTLSTSEVLRCHFACRARPAHQRHFVGLHNTRGRTRCRQTQDSRCRNMLQVCLYMCGRNGFAFAEYKLFYLLLS